MTLLISFHNQLFTSFFSYKAVNIYLLEMNVYKTSLHLNYLIEMN